jgi:formyltetrahydrofolate deformylase
MRLLVACADQPGIVAAIASSLRDAGANIVSSHQHSTDPEGGRFFMRTEFNPVLEGDRLEGFRADFAASVAGPFAMEWALSDARRPKRLALLVSRHDHCLLDLLWRWRRGRLNAEVVLVASNHDDLRADAEGFGVPFHHVPVAAGAKREAERELLALVEDRVELVVLARYMQILSRELLDDLAVPVINIHHSFLPAFAGADPYAQARARGVKLIGATAHYATEELDAGPIIEQDVARISHRESLDGLRRLGEDLERIVLARAVQWHCEDRVIVDRNATVVF